MTRLFDLHQRILARLPSLDPPMAKDSPDGYYCYLMAACLELNPKVVVEFGAREGVSTVMMLAGMPLDSSLVSVDINPNSWRAVPLDPRLTKLIGDDSDFHLPINPQAVDLWFIDSDHSYQHTKKVWDLWSPHMKPGAIVFFDDIYLGATVPPVPGGGWSAIPEPDGGVEKVWGEIEKEKLDISEGNHFSGFGVVVV